SGTTDLKAGGTLGGSGGSFALDGGRVLQNDATFNWTNGSINMGTNPFGTSVGGSTIINSLGATFNDGVASTIFQGNGTNVFNNLGTFTTGFSSGTTNIRVAFNNSGSVQVGAGGTLNLAGGGNDVGAAYTGAGSIEFGGGTRTVDAASSIST